MFVASLDLGTTGCRTFIFDLAGTIIASDYQEWESFVFFFSYISFSNIIPSMTFIDIESSKYCLIVAER